MRVPSLRSVRFLPLVFIMGVDGFAMFAPYVIGMLTLAYAVRTLRPGPAAEPVPADVQLPV
jgi:hypothetical protein